ncbi:phage head completion protein [Novacetimonas hansenii]|uniref:Uncharacterized protein n=1 Tax=Novacetimonas hansenii TaxID=436 RepID=A0ABQ0SGU4_NOVHA|nr:hypothetical protein [Novacetimonas hansenii]GAN84041.1 hypothetical protein Gaha_0122_041 [Novacetimonas hansenii JCM 7643]GBQ55854.1 hypothetical protein AA0243_1029 [Novacetimonas hansenii NRIC 0243]GEC64621.1 hypothetical protein GHA01_24700 [Novacetimonas hansenii]
MISTNEIKRQVSFYKTETLPIKDSEFGGNTEQYTFIRSEMAALYPLNPMKIVDGVQEDIRKSTHILTTRYMTDIDSFTSVTTLVYEDTSFTTTRTELYKVNDVQLVNQEGRYLVCHLTLEDPNFTGTLPNANTSQ